MIIQVKFNYWLLQQGDVRVRGINNNEQKIEDIQFEFKDYENTITYEEIFEVRQF